jgi:hypothetical protein
MKRGLALALLLLLCLAVVLAAAGCMGAMTTDTTAAGASSTTLAATTTLTSEGQATDELSTFKSKDPFIPQALPPSTNSTGAGGSTSSTQSGGSTTTTYYSTTTTGYYPTTLPTSSTSSTSSTSTTSTTVIKHVHSLKILSISVSGTTPIVTFQVDNSLYTDKTAGSIINTSFGQIKIVSIDPDAQTVTLLQGSETHILPVGGQILK